MILVDSSVWIDHFRSADAGLIDHLNAGRVLTHPAIVGELACGNLTNRQPLLSLLQGLPAAPIASDGEALAFIDAHRLMGRGIGYIDVHLLASTALTGGARLWARDRRLVEAADALGLRHPAH